MYGFTANYVKVETDYDPLLINEITPVLLKNITQDGYALSEINYSNSTINHVS
jgi:threonylcarbamoyladenosine tRNA methylthiotransferase MtaB